MTEGTPTPPPPGAPPGGAPPGGPTFQGTPRSFGERLVGALRLDSGTYDEIEHDPSALGQAAGVVAIAAVASAIAGATGGAATIFGAMVGAFVGWFVSTGIVWLIGVRMMGHTSDYPELLRTLGFASAPQILMVVALVPVLGALVSIVVFFWGLAAYVVAVRQALDVETGRAIVVCVLGWGAAMLLILLLGGLARGCAGGPGMMG
jgi:hypothetical protein